MPKEAENDIEEMNDVSEIMDEAEGAKAPESSANAASSAATDVSNTVADDDTLSVVRDVVDKRTETEAAASSATREEVGQATDELKPEVGPDNENFSDVPFNKHPRFQEVLRQRNEFKTDAVRYQNVQNFITEQGLEAPEVANLLVIGGLMKTNPAEAWRRMKPTVEQVLIAAGEVLPEDLKAMVQSGEMTREAAMLVSRSRAEVNSVNVRQQFEQGRQETQQQINAANAVRSAVDTWESTRRARDPNFDAKLPAIQKEVAWLLQTEGKPDTPEGVRDQLQRAYDAVTAVPTAKPQQKPTIRPVTGGNVGGNARPTPNSTLDIINQVVAKRGRASA